MFIIIFTSVNEYLFGENIDVQQTDIIEENDNSNQDEAEVYEPVKNLKWKRNATYITPNIDWYIPPLNDIESLPLPSEYFFKYIKNEMFELMVEMTMQYAYNNGVHNFPETNVDEMKTFFGILIVMGNLQFPRVRMYWDSTLGISLIKNNMNVNRFFKLRQNFHVVDNNAPRNSNDRCWKVRPLLNAIRERCRELPLELSLCVDEQIIPFKGTISIKQYMKDKPESWGIKVYCLCGSSGILYDFIVYQGVTTEYREEYKAFGICAGTMMQLSERITEPNHQLYFDNFFSTYALFQWLKNRQIYAVGTIRINRFGNPPLLSDKDMKKKPRGFSQEVLSDNGNLIIAKWYDNKPVTLGSNYVSIGNQDICRRWDKKNKLYIDVKRPEIIQKYNKNMGGVDNLDFLLKIYRTFIKSKKWTLRIMTHCIDMALANS